jgi:hypothetical protein
MDSIATKFVARDQNALRGRRATYHLLVHEEDAGFIANPAMTSIDIDRGHVWITVCRSTRRTSRRITLPGGSTPRGTASDSSSTTPELGASISTARAGPTKRSSATQSTQTC